MSYIGGSIYIYIYSWGGIRKNRALLAKFLKFCIVLGMIMSI